jgi:uncharacterized protein (TIGR02145 family)
LDTGKSEDEVKSDGEWKRMFDYDEKKARAAWCYYDNDRANGAKFGRIYAPHDLYKLCPRGWRVPQWDDWAELLRSCGVSEFDISKKVVTGDAAERALAAMQRPPFNAVLAGTRWANSASSGSGVTFHGATSKFSFAVLGDFDAARGAYTIYEIGYSMQQMPSVPTLKYYNTSPIISGVSVRLIEEERVSGLRCARVGKQVWMAENWDGDMAGAIKQAQSAKEWELAYANGVPAWCYHDQNPGNARGWGKLYNKHVLNGSKKTFPAGWRAATVEDVMTLIKFYNDGKELFNRQHDKKSLAVWRILRDGPFKATAGGCRNTVSFTIESTEFVRATWMMEGDVNNSVIFDVDLRGPAEEIMFHLVPAQTMGGSIRLIRS